MVLGRTVEQNIFDSCVKQNSDAIFISQVMSNCVRACK